MTTSSDSLPDSEKRTPTLEAQPTYRDGEPCSHRGCLSHISHPCEGCGRIGGRSAGSSEEGGTPEQEANVGAELSGPMHQLGRELTGEALAVPTGRTEVDMVAEEAEVLSTCMIALARLPRLRREPVFDYLKQRLASVSILEVLSGMARETAPAIASVRHVNYQLNRQVAELQSELRALRREKKESKND